MFEDNKNILVVDADKKSHEVISRVLKEKGYRVDCVESGTEAVKMARKLFFNVALIDMSLTDVDSLELIDQIHIANLDIMPIMTTTNSSVEESVKAMAKGAVSYIQKPLNMDQLLIVIERAFEQQRLSFENKRLLQELWQANRKLEALDERKSAFVATVSHEFKNPLFAVKEFLSFFLEGHLGEITDKQKDVLNRCHRTMERLLRLVMDILDLSKIESGKMELKRTEIQIYDFVNDVLKIQEHLIREKKQKMTINMSKDIGSFWADEDKINQLMANIASNAIKYSPDKAEITVNVIGNDKEIRFEIKDTGEGLTSEECELVFDKFERVTVNKQEGTGLGLPIAKDIVELHKGKIWVESEKGKGSTFIFVLPRDLRD